MHGSGSSCARSQRRDPNLHSSFARRKPCSCRPITSTPLPALPQQHIEFLNHRSERLVGTLTDPEPRAPDVTSSSSSPDAGPGPSSSTLPPVVILAHGYMSSRNSELLVRLSTALARSCQLASLRYVPLDLVSLGSIVQLTSFIL